MTYPTIELKIYESYDQGKNGYKVIVFDGETGPYPSYICSQHCKTVFPQNDGIRYILNADHDDIVFNFTSDGLFSLDIVKAKEA